MLKVALVRLLDEAESSTKNTGASHQPPEIRYVKMDGVDPSKLPDDETVVVCDGRRVNGDASCHVPVWVYPQSSLCKFLHKHKASRHVPHPATVDARYSTTTWASKEERETTLETLETQCDVIETRKTMQEHGAFERDSITNIILRLISKMLKQTKTGRALETVRGIYDYYTPEVMKRLNRRIGAAVVHSVQWVWRHPFWSVYAVSLSKMLHTFLCLVTQGVEREQLLKLGRKVIQLYAKPATMVGRMLLSLWSVVVECVLPQMRNVVTANAFGTLRDLLSCVRTALVGFGRAGDAMMQFFVYWGDYFADTTGSRTVFEFMRRTLQPKQQVLTDIENVVRITEMPENAMVIHVAYSVLRRVPASVLLFIADMISVALPSSLEHMIKDVHRDAADLMEYVLTNVEELTVLKDTFVAIMDLVCDICRYVMCVVSNRLGLTLDLECCPAVGQLVKVLKEEADYLADERGEDEWLQTRDFNDRFDAEASKRKHFSETGMIDWSKHGIAWKPWGYDLKEGL